MDRGNERRNASYRKEHVAPCSHSPQRKAISCRWIYEVTYNVDDTTNWYKAKLVAEGYVQTDKVDYEETFASVEKMMTI